MDQIERDERPCTHREQNPESWNEHEHLSSQLELDAMRLLADAGTPELAKFAIDAVEQQHNDQMRFEFAQSLGFESFGELLAASAEIRTNDSELWFVTVLSDGRWVGWNYGRFQADVCHPTREAAVVYVERSMASISDK